MNTASRIQKVQSYKKKTIPVASMLPGLRGSTLWHQRASKEGETPHTINHFGGRGYMALPAGDDVRSQVVRLHEMAHAAHSPIEAPRPIVIKGDKIIFDEFLVLAEEFRINTYVFSSVDTEVKRAYLEAEYPQMKAVLEHYLEISDWEGFRYFILCLPFLRHPLGHDMLIDIDLPVTSILWEVGRLIQRVANWSTEKPIPAWDEYTIPIAEFLQDLHHAMDPQNTAAGEEEGSNPNMVEELSDDPEMANLISGAGYVTHSNSNPDVVKSHHNQRLRDMLFKKYDPDYDDQFEGEPIWGKMTIREASTMSGRLPRKYFSKSKFRGTDEGSVPRYIHRLPIDSKIFGRKKRSGGGTVLIDDSGSMGWSEEEIEEIMKAAPSATIAAYSGSVSKGELVILAKDGRYVSGDREIQKERPAGGNNLVDGPALEWLAKQKGPRIWVSDTMITVQTGDIQKAYKQVLETIYKNQINVVRWAQEAADIFNGKRAVYR